MRHEVENVIDRSRHVGGVAGSVVGSHPWWTLGAGLGFGVWMSGQATPLSIGGVGSLATTGLRLVTLGQFLEGSPGIEV